MGQAILVSYAGARADPALEAQLLRAQEMQAESAGVGGINHVITWSRARLEATDFYRENEAVLTNPRGSGFWLWKPYIILEALHSAGPDDVIVYWDVGQVRPYTFTRSIAPLLRWCRQHDGMLPGVPVLPQGNWTKRDCFHYMGCDAPPYWKALQIQATFSLWSGRAAGEFVAEWLNWCKDRRCLTDEPNQCGLPNLPGFYEHRHDQAVLTNLCLKKRVQAPPALSIPPGLWTKNINVWSELLDELPGKVDAVAEAERAWKILLDHEPGQPFAQHRLARGYLQTDRVPAALDLLRQAAKALPRLPDVQCDLAVALQRLGHIREAAGVLERVVTLEHAANLPMVLVQLGNVAAALGDAVRAEVAYRQAILTDERHVPAWARLAEQLLGQSRHDEAIRAFGRVVSLRPEDALAHSQLLHAMHRSPSCSDLDIAEQHEAWSRHHGVRLAKAPRHLNDRSPQRKLRIGYLRPGIQTRLVTAFLDPLQLNHRRDADGFDVFTYSSPAAGADETVDRIRRDRIDILVDLAGHSAQSQLAVCVQKPAPIQIAWLGHPHARRLAAIDYTLTDDYLDPHSTAAAAGSDNDVLQRLPIFACYKPPDTSPALALSPAEHTQLVTFGYLGDPTGVTTDVLRLWCRILRATPGSRLLLRSDFDSPAHREVLSDEQIDPARVETVRRFSSARAYFEAFHWIDVALDSFPHSAHLSSCDALWVGVPVVTLTGARRESRLTASVLAHLPLPELIANSSDKYFDAAVELANDRRRLAEYRRTLRDRMRASVVTRAAEFTRSVEGVYRRLWKRWCAAQQQETRMVETLEPDVRLSMGTSNV
jgi:protein O-GlcNAc transferase